MSIVLYRNSGCSSQAEVCKFQDAFLEIVMFDNLADQQILRFKISMQYLWLMARLNASQQLVEQALKDVRCSITLTSNGSIPLSF
jgi:hypothetical protein